MGSNPLPMVLALGISIMIHAANASADIMTTCTSEISRYCADVSEGAGRIVACLVGQMGRLSPACLTDVQAQGPMAPNAVRMVVHPRSRASLPEGCKVPAAKFCPGMKPGEGRVFACLYARSDRVPKTCADAAQAALEEAK
jgi:hypothetical protein